MTTPELEWNRAGRERVFERFYRLTARDLMDSEMAHAAFLGEHCDIVTALEVLSRADHAWTFEQPAVRRSVRSVVLRRDLLRALEPAQSSYSRFAKVKFRSMAHGSADCICCFTQGRVLHPVSPDTSCLDVLHTVEAKDVLYLPVVEDDHLLGEIAAVQLIRAVRQIWDDLAAQR